MPDITEETISRLLEAGNGASEVVASAGGGFRKVSYLWGKLRVDICDEAGKILLPARRVGGGDIPTTPAS